MLSDSPVGESGADLNNYILSITSSTSDSLLASSCFTDNAYW